MDSEDGGIIQVGRDLRQFPVLAQSRISLETRPGTSGV